MRKNEKGNTLVEAALLVPVMVLLLMGMVEIGRITYTYYSLKKMLQTVALYASKQQGANLCDPADPLVEAVKTNALTGDSGPIITGLTAEMISIRIERYNSSSGDFGECECSVSGCDIGAGGRSPDYIVVSIPDGYQVRPRIPYLPVEPIPLKPEIRVPFGAT